MYSFDSRVRYSECDEHGNLSLLSLINYLQDCAIFHSESIGRSADYMTSRGLAWLIATWQIEIARLPRFYDEIRVTTWCHSMTRTFACRNFVLSTPDGTQLVRADSRWFVFDVAAGKPIRIPQDQLVYLEGDTPLDMPPTERRLRVEGPYEEAPALTVVELHLDTNRHVNNAQYLGMATNALAALEGQGDTLRASDIQRICIQYKQQAKLGDMIVPRLHRGDGSVTVDLVSPEGESYAVVRIELRP